MHNILQFKERKITTTAAAAYILTVKMMKNLF